MVKLPPTVNRTAAAIYALHKSEREDWRRPHLGASVIGDENCLRHLWYSFRWASEPDFDGQLLRLFERGHLEEARIVSELKRVGWDVEDVDPETGEQRRVAFFGGHFSGSSDGQVLGVFEAPKTNHLLEVKTSNAKRFAILKKDGVQKSNPGHYAQMQTYMHGLKLKRALYICVCKDNDEIYSERVHYDKAFAEAIVLKARTVVTSAEPLSKIKEDPSWFECKFCNHRPICHIENVDRLDRNCRTCASSTPLDNGTWVCEFLQKELSVDEQREGCKSHLFIPQLLPWKWVDFHEHSRRAVYEQRDGAQIVDHERKLMPWQPN